MFTLGNRRLLFVSFHFLLSLDGVFRPIFIKNPAVDLEKVKNIVDFWRQVTHRNYTTAILTKNGEAMSRSALFARVYYISHPAVQGNYLKFWKKEKSGDLWL